MYKKKKIIAISYGDALFSMSLKLNLITAKLLGGADSTIAYTPESLSSEFREKNEKILANKRGGGYWVWKPYILLETLQKCREGEYIIYTDAGILYLRSIKRLIRQMEEDNQSVFLSMGFAPLKHWCKRDAFEFMNAPIEDFGDLPCLSGGWVIIKNNDEAKQFVEEWNSYIQNENILTDVPNICGLPNDNGYHEHRHDQAILTIIAKKMGIIPYRSVSYVDCPRAHRKVFEGNIAVENSVYGYTKDELIIHMNASRKYSSSENHRRKRVFINTGLRNQKKKQYIYNLFYSVYKAFQMDRWGKKNDIKFVKMEK